jgi:nitrous oxidase accessory protein
MKKFLAVSIILLFIGTAIIPSNEQNIENLSLPTSRGNTLYVGGSGPENYSKIQDAVNNASNGDTIFVFTGIYNEQITINKSITLIGEDKNLTIINGSGIGDVVSFLADSVTFKCFTIQNSGGDVVNAGVSVKSNNDIIENNIYANNRNGIYIENSANNTVSWNVITNNGNQSYEGSGISLYNSTGNLIIENSIFANFGTGLIGTYTTQGNNIISRNNITDNTEGVLFYEFSNNAITYNNVTRSAEKGIEVIYSQNNSIVNNDICFTTLQSIAVFDSSNNTISRNTIKNSSYTCMEFNQGSFNNTVDRNIIRDSDEGFEIDGLYNRISNNTLMSISLCGISFNSHSHNNLIIENTIRQTKWAVLTGSSKHNSFYYNNLINNTQNVDHMTSDNLWDNGYPFGGNYWSDYTGTDSYTGQNQDIPGSDGIGDTPYGLDRYPLMLPYGTLRANANGPYNGSVAEGIQFIGFACGGTPPYNWSWTFGDGLASNEQNPVHSYSSARFYIVWVTVQDNKTNISTHGTFAEIKWNDTTPPTISIIKPKMGYVYRNDKELRKKIFFRKTTVIKGVKGITIEVNASDNKSGILNVEFFIDGSLQFVDTTPPYQWTWKTWTPLHFKHTIMVKAYDKAGNQNMTEINVWKFF